MTSHIRRTTRLLIGAATMLAIFASTAVAASTAASEFATAEAQGQGAVNALEASAQPGSPEAAYVAANYTTDPMLRVAMATNAVWSDQTTGDVTGFQSQPLLNVDGSLVASTYATRCHGTFTHKRYWSDPTTGIHLIWIGVQVGDSSSGGWCYNGSYITSVAGWHFPRWSNDFYCIENITTSHNGFGAKDKYGHTAWAHGGIWAQGGADLPVVGCVNKTSGAATARIAGNGYFDYRY